MVRASENNDGGKKKSAAMLGVGLDCDDGQTRLTRGENFVLCGGSQQTHEKMQETAVKVNEHLDRRGKRLEDVSTGEFHDIVREVVDSVGDSPNQDDHR
jgi:hypothetical protein